MTLSNAEVWPMVHAERTRLLDDLTPLDSSAWNTPSLCPGWTVHDVLAHIVDTAMTGQLAFVWSLVRSVGDFDRANDTGIGRRKRDDPRDTLADLQDALTLTRTPLASRATRLVEAFVHGEDIRRPLGLAGSYPQTGVHEALAYQLRTAVSFGGGRERAADCLLVDAESGETWGDGLTVRGRAIDLLLAVSGRRVEPGLLSGPGVARLTSR